MQNREEEHEPVAMGIVVEEDDATPKTSDSAIMSTPKGS